MRDHLRVLYIAYWPSYRAGERDGIYEGHGPDPNGPLSALRGNPVRLSRLVVTPGGEPAVRDWDSFFEMFVPERLEWSEQGEDGPSTSRGLDRLLFDELDRPRNHQPSTVQGFVLDDVHPPSLMPPPRAPERINSTCSIVYPPAFSDGVALDPLTYPKLDAGSIVVHLDRGITVEEFEERVQRWFESLRKHPVWREVWETRWWSRLDVRPMTDADLGVLESAPSDGWSLSPRRLWERTVFPSMTDLEEELYGWTETYTEEELSDEEGTDGDEEGSL